MGPGSTKSIWKRQIFVSGFAANSRFVIRAPHPASYMGLSSNQIHQQKPVRHSIRVIGQNSSAHAHENVSLSHHWHARFPCPGLTFLRICAAFGLLPASLSPRHSQTQCSLRESKLGLGRTSSGPRSTCNCRPTIIRLSVLVQTRRVSTQNTHFLPLSESSDVFTARKRRTSW